MKRRSRNIRVEKASQSAYTYVMNTRNIFYLLVLAALWGPSFLFMRVAVVDIPPLTIVLGRVGIGALLVLVALRQRGGHLPRSRTIWLHLAFLGFMQNALPFLLFAWGEQYIESALASILNGTTPIFTILLAHFLVEADRLTGAKIVGVLLGFAGLALLIAPALVGGLQATTWGMLALVAASICYAIAIVYARNHARGLPPLVGPAGQLLMATIYMLPLAVFIDKPWRLAIPATLSMLSVVALGVFGTGLAFIIYYRFMETAEPSIVSMVTYVVPVFGVILGVLVLGEQLTWNALAGFGLILLGVMIVNGLFANSAAARRINV
ncbi:MAG: DMT family transporter [Anaerolineales bacterium]|nr:DMT family transporter [Anaerolineales bacterium]